MVRLGGLLKHCLESDPSQNTEYQTCAIKTMAVYKSVMPWAIPRAIATSSCVEHLCACLAAPSVPMQLVSITETLREPLSDQSRHPSKHSTLCTAVPISLMRSSWSLSAHCTQVKWLTSFDDCSSGPLSTLMT